MCMSRNWMSVMLNVKSSQSQSHLKKKNRNLQHTESKWIHCPRCYQLEILSSVANFAVSVDASIPDIKRHPSRRLNRPQTAGVRALFQVFLQCISVKIQKVFFNTTSFLSHLSAALLDLFIFRMVRLQPRSFFFISLTLCSKIVLLLLCFVPAPILMLHLSQINGCVLTSVHPDALQSFFLFSFWNFWLHTVVFGSKLFPTL